MPSDICTKKKKKGIRKIVWWCSLYGFPHDFAPDADGGCWGNIDDVVDVDDGDNEDSDGGYLDNGDADGGCWGNSNDDVDVADGDNEDSDGGYLDNGDAGGGGY